MKRKILLIICTFFWSLSAKSQEVSCSELLEYVQSNGRSKATVSSLSLYDSSWLNEVKAYSIEGNIAVVAKITRNEYDLYGKEYIFCGVPSENWDAFYYGTYDYNLTYGERFHKYIMNYGCKCD